MNMIWDDFLVFYLKNFLQRANLKIVDLKQFFNQSKVRERFDERDGGQLLEFGKFC